MKSIVRFSIQQTVFINVIFVILIIAGLFSMANIPVENVPTVDIGKVFIHTSYFGASAKDVEQLVTQKIEDALEGMEHVEYIQSASYRNFSNVQVKFIDDADYKDLFDELRFRALNIKNELPENAEEPYFLYIDTHVWIPVIVVNIAGDIPQKSLKLFAQELKSEILAVPNIRDVEILGEFTKEFHVSIDPEKLRKYGITFDTVAKAIEAANTKIPTGRFRTNDRQYMLDAGLRASSQEEVLQIPVQRDGSGNFIFVRDLVTNARISYQDPHVIPSVNGDNTLMLRVIKEDQGNAVTISKAVKALSKQFSKRHEKDGIHVVFNMDSTIEINDSVKTLGANLLLGMFFVLIILWLTLGFRNAMLTAIGIPFAFLCSIIIMFFAGVTLNTISLFAFVLVTGIMVDDAVIIMENIYRHIQMGKTRKEAVIDGTAEVMLPVISSALTTILAFLPMLIMTGSTGEFFAQIPKTVTYALIASLAEALFILPIHILDWGPKPQYIDIADESANPFIHLQSGLFAPIWKIYYKIICTFLKHKILTLLCIFLLFCSAIAIFIVSITGIFPIIPVQFFPGNYYRYHVAVIMPENSSIEATDSVVRGISRFIMSIGPGQAQSTSGSSGYYEDEDYARHQGHRYGEIIVTLPEDKDRDFPENPTNDPMKHLSFIRKRLHQYLTDQYDPTNRPKIIVFEEGDGPPTGKPVNIRVTGLTLDDAIKASDEIMTFIKNAKELDELIDLEDNRPGYHRTFAYEPRQQAIIDYGLNPGQVTGFIASALNGYKAGEYRAIDEEVDLMVRLARTDDIGNIQQSGLKHPSDILNVPVIEHSSSPILLRDLVQMKYIQEPSVLNRYKGLPVVTITADIKQGSQLSSARVKFLVQKFYQTIQSNHDNVTISFGGEFESTSKSYRSMTFAFFIALLMIYLVLASQFNDYFHPVIIISAVPFSIIGVVYGLLLTRTVFTIGSFMAIVGLAGVAVNDSLLMIEFMKVLRAKGKTLRESIIEACAARMRPVLITTITTLLGLLPMAVGIPKKSIAWAPMATAFVAGLCSATILVLLIIPVEYEFFEKSKETVVRLFGRKSDEKSE